MSRKELDKYYNEMRTKTMTDSRTFHLFLANGTDVFDDEDTIFDEYADVFSAEIEDEEYRRLLRYEKFAREDD